MTASAQGLIDAEYHLPCLPTASKGSLVKNVQPDSRSELSLFGLLHNKGDHRGLTGPSSRDIPHFSSFALPSNNFLLNSIRSGRGVKKKKKKKKVSFHYSSKLSLLFIVPFKWDRQRESFINLQ